MTELRSESSSPSSNLIVVSVCIANFNGEKLIARCIESVQAQKNCPPIEIIVHDDGSSDDSIDVIKSYPGVVLIASEKNVGYCESNNRMVAASSGKYVLLLNNDAQLLPDAVKTLYDAAENSSEEAILSLPQFEFESGDLLDQGMLLDIFCNPVPNTSSKRNEVMMVMGACMWMPRALWEKIDGMPSFFRNLGEDLYMCLYARILGTPVRALADSGFRHHVGATIGGGKPIGSKLCTTYARRAASERNKTYAIVLFYPIFPLILVLPAHLSLLVLEAIVLSLARGTVTPATRIYLPVLYSLIRNFSMLNRARRQIQQRRRISTRTFSRQFLWYPWKLRMLCRYGIPDIK